LYTYSEVDVEVQVYAGQHQVLGRLLDDLLGDPQLLLREEPAQNWKKVRGEVRGERGEGEGRGSYCRLTYLEVLLQQRDVSEVCEEESEEA